MYILEQYMYWIIYVMMSSISIGSVPVRDSGIINKWMNEHSTHLLFRFKLLFQNTKLTICKTLIKPILVYGPKTWTVTMGETDTLRVFERTIVRKIHGPVHEEQWRIMTIQKIRNMLQEEDVVKFIKTLWLRWYGHAERMQSERMPNQTAKAIMEGTRTSGKSCKWCRDKVEEDLNITGLKNRRARSKECQEWRKIVLEATVHYEL